MSKSTAKSKLNLLVVAHPDDESLFFAGLLMKHPNKFCVACVTDGNADGQGEIRKKQIEAACRLLKVKDLVFLNFPDVYENRLNLPVLRAALRELDKPLKVYTHGPVGEYGHPHHQDVCMAVHEAYQSLCPVFSIAHNCYPDLSIKLTAKQYKLKSQILHDIYFSETKRFIQYVPCASVENYARFDIKEVKAVYEYLALKKPFLEKDLNKYSWYTQYLPILEEQLKNRPF